MKDEGGAGDKKAVEEEDVNEKKLAEINFSTASEFSILSTFFCKLVQFTSVVVCVCVCV